MLGGVCALRLAEAGHRVALLEAAPSLGGLTSQLSHNDIQWDRFYHVIEHVDTELLALLADLGLSERLRWRVTKTNFYDGENIYPLNNAFDYLRLPALSAIDKVRIGLTIVYGASIKDASRLEAVGLEDWLLKWSGKSAFEKLWLPLLRGKLGDNYKISSAAFIWSVIQRFYGARSGAQKTESFGYVKGGYARIIETLESRLRHNNVEIYTQQKVSAVAKADKQLKVETDELSLSFDKVLFTTPSSSIGKLCPDLGETEKQAHATLRYQGVVCVSLLLQEPLGGAYLTYITGRNLPFTTIIEMTTLVDDVGHVEPCAAIDVAKFAGMVFSKNSCGDDAPSSLNRIWFSIAM